MEELENFAAQQDGYLGWVGVRTSPEDQQFLPLMGFDADSSGYIWDHVDEAYPFYELSMHEDVPLRKLGRSISLLCSSTASTMRFLRKTESV